MDMYIFVDGFCPYLVQMINSMRGCVACDNPWAWPISSRSFGLDLITIIRGCVACYFFHNLEIWIFDKFLKFFACDLEKKSTVLNGFFQYLAQMITSMRWCVAYNDLWPWPIYSMLCSVAFTVLDGFFPCLIQMITSMRMCVASHVMTFDLDLNLQGHSTLTLKIVSTL